MGLFNADGDDGYDRRDEEDDFVGWSDKRRAEALPPSVEEPPAKALPKTLTERLADAATARESTENADAG
jgi:hypothetical protein